MATVAQSAEQGTAGIVIWGDHLTEKTKTDCLEIKSYIDNFLGPLVKNLTAITQTCSQKFCNSHGRCTFELNSQRIDLGHQHGRRFIVLGHQYGCHDVM